MNQQNNSTMIQQFNLDSTIQLRFNNSTMIQQFNNDSSNWINNLARFNNDSQLIITR